MENNLLEKIEKMSIQKALATFVVPSITAMIVQIIYNLVDSYFVGKIGDTNQMAAMSVTMPFMIFITAVAGIPASGGSSIISRLLGEKKQEEAKIVSASAMFLTIILSIIFTLVIFIGKNAFLYFSGSSYASFDYANSYLTIILAGTVFIMLSFTLSQLIRAQGAAHISMMGMLIGTGLNIILDPILIFVFGLGIKGAAIATVLSNIASLGYYIIFIISKGGVVSLKPALISRNISVYLEMTAIGIGVSISQVIMAIATGIANKISAQYGDATVAAIGIVFKNTTIAIFIFMGLSMGIQPLIGYFYGSGNISKMKATIKMSLMISFVAGLVIGTVFIVARGAFIGIFLDKIEVIRIGRIILFAYALPLPLLGVSFVFMSIFQSMGKAVHTLIISVFRQGVLYIPLMFILNKIYGFYGFIYSQAISDLLCTLLIVFMYLNLNRHISTQTNDDILYVQKECRQ